VVGNVVAGGGGKTPLTVAIVDHLKTAGYAVGIVSRGYGRQQGEVREVHLDSQPSEVGDEPLMMKRRCEVPVFVAQRRVEAAQALLAAYPDTQVLVCDGGLQHLALARDIGICAMDARGIGNGRCLPAGPLREAWPRTVDLLVHTGERSLPEGFGSHRALSSGAVDAHGHRTALHSLQSQTVHAVAAIAQPQAFFAMLQAQGLSLGQTFALKDHADFDDWTAPAGNVPLLCPEKDAVKLWARDPTALAVPLPFLPEPAFFGALVAQLTKVRKG